MSLPMDNTPYWHAKLVLEETHVISFKFGVFSVLMLRASSPTWLSCLTETVVPLPLLGLVPYHGVQRGPTAVAVPCPSLQPLGGRLEKLSLTPQCCQPQGQHPEWEQGCIRHRGCEYRPANTEKKEVWTPSYICVFAVCA